MPEEIIIQGAAYPRWNNTSRLDFSRLPASIAFIRTPYHLDENEAKRSGDLVPSPREPVDVLLRCTLTGCLANWHTVGISPSIREITAVRRYASVPFLMETGMQSEKHKKAAVGAFLNRSALFLLMLPVAFFFWALHAYPAHEACWLGVATAIYVWPVAGVLFVIAAGFHVGPASQRMKTAAELRQAHGH